MNITFGYLVTSFFTSYLAAEQGLAHNTIASYSDCIRLLVNYICERAGIEPEALNIKEISPELVLEFLDHIEQQRQNSPVTRNQRLAAIKTFFHFLARHVPELLHANEHIQAIRLKKTDHHPPPSLTAAEVDAILAVPNADTLRGARDKAWLHLLYNTGARVQELVDLTQADFRFEARPTVTLTGKGRKKRVIPLWKETVEILEHYLRLRSAAARPSTRIFLNSQAQPLTRFGIGRRLDTIAQAAAAHCPSLQGRRITPHMFRHTTALHLIESGNDITIVKDWLGHADIKTASLYVEVSLERKRRALEKVPPPDGGRPTGKAHWKQPDLMKFLIHCSRPEHYVV